MWDLYAAPPLRLILYRRNSHKRFYWKFLSPRLITRVAQEMWGLPLQAPHAGIRCAYSRRWPSILDTSYVTPVLGAVQPSAWLLTPWLGVLFPWAHPWIIFGDCLLSSITVFSRNSLSATRWRARCPSQRPQPGKGSPASWLNSQWLVADHTVWPGPGKRPRIFTQGFN